MGDKTALPPVGLGLQSCFRDVVQRVVIQLPNLSLHRLVLLSLSSLSRREALSLQVSLSRAKDFLLCLPCCKACVRCHFFHGI